MSVTFSKSFFKKLSTFPQNAARAQIEHRDPSYPKLLIIQGKKVSTFYCEYKRGKKHKLGRVGEISLELAHKECIGLLEKDSVGLLDGCDITRKTVKDFVNTTYRHKLEGSSNINKILKGFDSPILNTQMTKLNANDIEDWYHRNVSRKAEDNLPSAATLKRRYNALRAVFNWAVKRRHLLVNHIAGYKFKGVDNGFRPPFENDDLDKLRDALNTDHEANAKMVTIVKLMALTGARPGEIMKAQRENIQERGILTVSASYTKTKKTRRIRLSHAAMAVINQWMKSGYEENPQGYLFVSQRTGSHLTTVNKYWREFVKRNELEHTQMYSLRHTFATRALEAGVNIRTLQELLGHSDIRVTEGYAHYTDEGLSNAVEDVAAGIKLAA